MRGSVQVERLLLEQNRLRDEKKLLDGKLQLAEKALQLQQQIAAAAQGKVGEPDAGDGAPVLALNQIHEGSRQNYEPSSERKDRQEREGEPRQYK